MPIIGERRSAPRVKLTENALVSAGGRAFLAQTQDVSATGLCLSGREPAQPGEVVSVTLPVRLADQTVWTELAASVTRTAEQDGRFVLGLALVQPTAPLLALIAALLG